MIPKRKIITQDQFDLAYQQVQNTQSIVEAIVVGLLTIEEQINRYLNKKVLRPQFLWQGTNLSYEKKLRFAQSLGFIKNSKQNYWEDLILYYEKIGNLRNKFAHNLNYQLSQADLHLLQKINETFQFDNKPKFPKTYIEEVEYTKYAMSILMSFAAMFAN